MVKHTQTIRRQKQAPWVFFRILQIVPNRATHHIIKYYTFFLDKQSIFDPRPENCLSFSKKSPWKIV